MVTKSFKIHGFLLLLFCALNAFVIVVPYSEMSEKGYELFLIPVLFDCAVILHSFYAGNTCPIRFKYDIGMLSIMALIALITFNLPNPDLIWVMMVFVFFVYIPILFALFGRGLFFLLKSRNPVVSQ